MAEGEASAAAAEEAVVSAASAALEAALAAVAQAEAGRFSNFDEEACLRRAEEKSTV